MKRAATERNLKLIIDTTPALIWSTGPDGITDSVNQHFLDYVGLSWGATARPRMGGRAASRRSRRTHRCMERAAELPDRQGKQRRACAATTASTVGFCCA